MKISIKNLCTADAVCELSVDFEVEETVVLIDHDEYRAGTLLKKLVDIDAEMDGTIFIDGIAKAEYFAQHPIASVFGYVFDEGIMLSNLSIRENLMLPYRLRWGSDKLEDFDVQVHEWLQVFEMEMDLELRPAFVKPSLLKMMCFIRSLLLQPQVLLIDNPYYLLNQAERTKILQIIRSLKPRMKMIIASTDLDFADDFAPTVLNFENNNRIVVKSIAIT